MMKKLTCHCGGVEAEVSLPNGLKNFVRCNCSICKKKGIIMVKNAIELLVIPILDEII